MKGWRLEGSWKGMVVLDAGLMFGEGGERMLLTYRSIVPLMKCL